MPVCGYAPTDTGQQRRAWLFSTLSTTPDAAKTQPAVTASSHWHGTRPWAFVFEAID